MAKKEKVDAGQVPAKVQADVAGAVADLGAMPGTWSCSCKGPLFQAYLFMLSAVDWSRDLRKKKTICSDCLKDARLAVEVFEQETKTEK